MLSCILIVSIAMIFLLRFFWPAAIMLFAFAGITSVGGILGVILGLMHRFLAPPSIGVMGVGSPFIISKKWDPLLREIYK